MLGVGLQCADAGSTLDGQWRRARRRARCCRNWATPRRCFAGLRQGRSRRGSKLPKLVSPFSPDHAPRPSHDYITPSTDLRCILAKDRSNASALAELDSVRALKRTKRSADLPGDEDDEPYVDVPDLEEASDSEDCTHAGNGAPCRPYNHSGCTSGARCHHSHAPDKRSVRDELCVPHSSHDYAFYSRS